MFGCINGIITGCSFNPSNNEFRALYGPAPDFVVDSDNNEQDTDDNDLDDKENNGINNNDENEVEEDVGNTDENEIEDDSDMYKYTLKYGPALDRNNDDVDENYNPEDDLYTIKYGVQLDENEIYTPEIDINNEVDVYGPMLEFDGSPEDNATDEHQYINKN